MTSTQTSTPPPEREGVGNIILIGMLVGVIVVPLAIYFGMDVFGQFGPACNPAGGNEDLISCDMRQIIMSGMGIPVGAIFGFIGGYMVALRKWK
jgi:hypothetical protein